MTKEIAKLIVIAQASSDVGKGINDLYRLLDEKLKRKAKCGYPVKDLAIYELLCIISGHPQKDVHFYVCRDADKIALYVVYFDFMLGCDKVQVSFHSFDKRIERFIARGVKSCTKWRSDIESRSMAYALAVRNGFLSRP
jgi:hypothetical protein